MKNEDRTSTDLIEQVQKGGDAEAWREFDEKYRAEVRRALVGRCSDQTADDVTQTVFLRILEQKAIWHKQGRFRTWLNAVARKTLAWHRRRQKRVHTAGVDAPWDRLLPSCGASDTFSVGVIRLAMAAFVCELLREEVAPREYQVFELRTFRRLPYEKVCELTGLDRNQAYRTNYAMKRRFREMATAHTEKGPPDEYIWRAWRSLEGSS